MYKIFIKNFLFSLLFYLLLFLLFYFLLVFFGKKEIFSENSFLHWDAEHYNFIKEKGYQNFRTAFFPLFPFLWKFISLSPIGISVLNGIIFLLSFSFLYLILNPNIDKYFFLLLSFPSLIFMFLPYTEAVFFFSAIVLLTGFYKNHFWMIIVGFFLCSLARPVTFIFLPAIWITEFFMNKNKIVLSIRNGSIYSLAVIAGLFTTFFLQHYYTGEWFSFFDSQKRWDNRLQLPQLTLTSWAGGKIVMLDGTALLIGTIAVIFIFRLLVIFIRKEELKIPKLLLFSILYLAGISLFVLLFRGGSLFSLNRFVYATPFFMICLYYFLKNIRFNLRQGLLVFFFLSVFWLLFGSYEHIQTFLKFEGLTLYIILFLLLSSEKKTISRSAFLFILLGNIFLTLYFYFRFFNGEWVG
ncbi:MAG: hypothetical protein V1781_09630 [Bacteroidota bacterium]